MFSDEKLWSSREHRQGYFRWLDEEYVWESGSYHNGLKDKPASCYLLLDGRYVDFDTTLRDEEKPLGGDTGDIVYGIRPLICIKPSDPGMFVFKNSDELYKKMSGWKCWEKEGNFLRSPASDENIEDFRKEYRERSGKEPVLPEDYVRFLKFSDGLAYGPLVLFGTTQFSVTGEYGYEEYISPLINKNLPLISMHENLLYIGCAKHREGDSNTSCMIYYDMEKDRYYVDRDSYVSGIYRTECFGFEEAFGKIDDIVKESQYA